MHNKPNIIFILIDDLGWIDLSCYGSKFYETPNLDKLADEGLKFSNAYAASPVCSPTRASILTGKYPARLKMTNYIEWSGKPHNLKGKLKDAPYINFLPTKEECFPKVLKENGYNTWHVGKWHLGESLYYPEKHGFDVNIGGCNLGMPVNGYFSPYGIETLEDGPDGEYLTDRLTDEAIDLIKNNDGKPFFLNLWYYSVHIPIQAKEEDINKFKKKAKDMNIDQEKAIIEGEKFPTYDKDGEKISRRIIQSEPVYAAMIYNLDRNIGKIFNELENLNIAKDTVVIFTSDNGGLSTAEGSPTCNYPLSEGKGWMYDGGVRVPLIIKWPGVTTARQTCDTPVISTDYYSTIIDIANIELDEFLCEDGVSLLPLIKGEKDFDRGPIFWHYPHYGNQGGTPGSAVRMKNFKLIKFYEDNRLELYDLDEDIKESKNLASEFPMITTLFHDLLLDWQAEINVVYPKENK